MYFASRTEAGKQLAQKLEKYRFEDTAIMALSDGGVVVGAQIAAKIHCPLLFLLQKDINLPGETSVLGVVDEKGGFTYNDMFSTGQLEEFSGEYHHYIEQEKMKELHKLHEILTDGGLADPSILKNRNIILVSDGFMNGMSLIAAVNFLKPVLSKKVVVASPIASVAAVDHMHLAADELHVLSVVEGTFAIDHYYEKNDVPEQQKIIEILNTAILQWQ